MTSHQANWLTGFRALALPVAHLLGLGLSALMIGAILRLYEASGLIWVGTLAVTLHLAWAETAAIAVAMVWLIAVIWMAVLSSAMPHRAPMVDGRDWAMMLGKFWLLGTVYTLLMGYVGQSLAPWRLKRTFGFWLRLGVAWGALGLGATIRL